MSRLSRALQTSSLRNTSCTLKGSVLAPPRTQIARSSTAASTTATTDSPLAAHLNTVFSPLQFPQELSRRILTHGSHPEAVHGHNGRLAFIGRRVLESYYLLFVHDSAKASAEYNYDALSERALNSYVLGEHVAPQWSLGKVLRWVPTIPRNTIEAAREHLPDAELTDALSVNPGVVRSVGLYKVMGETVQAVIGGVYHQFGGSVAHRLFHTRILPHILLPNQHGGVPMEFHARALSISERMAGLEAKELKQ